jgi:hypothetical protein
LLLAKFRIALKEFTSENISTMEGKIEVILNKKKHVALEEQVAIRVQEAAASVAPPPLVPAQRGGLFGYFAQV